MVRAGHGVSGAGIRHRKPSAMPIPAAARPRMSAVAAIPRPHAISGALRDAPYGRIVNPAIPGARKGSASRANSHSSFRLSRGSMISSTQNASAVRKGERSF